MTNVVIVSAARTAVGSFNGAFAATPAHELGAKVLGWRPSWPGPGSINPKCPKPFSGRC